MSVARNHGIRRPIERVGQPNEVYTCPYGRLYNDAVIGPTGKKGTYLRWAWNGPGVVVVPTDGRRLYLWPMFRYPIGEESLEFPRGATEAGESVTDAAARELIEETGFTATSTMILGRAHADTGLITSSNTVVLAHIDIDSPGASQLEATEAITGPSLALTPDEMISRISGGSITCSLTISAFVHAIPHVKGAA